jgi:hypothetical protein
MVKNNGVSGPSIGPPNKNIYYHILVVLICRKQTCVGKHLTANFVIKGVGVKTVTSFVASYQALIVFWFRVKF